MKKYILLLTTIIFFISCTKRDGTVVKGNLKFYFYNQVGFVDSVWIIKNHNVILLGEGHEQVVQTDSNGEFCFAPIKKGTYEVDAGYTYFNTSVYATHSLPVYNNHTQEVYVNLEFKR